MKKLNTEEFLDIDIEDIMKMSTDELRRLAGAGRDLANRRIRSLKDAGATSSPAMRAIHPKYRESGFTTAGKSRRSLISEVRSERQFLLDPTSTVKGFRKATKRAEDALSPAGEAAQSGEKIFDTDGREVPKPRAKRKGPKEKVEGDIVSGRNLSKKSVGKFWDMFHKYAEKHGLQPGANYNEVLYEAMSDYFEQADMRQSVDHLLDGFEDFLEEQYEESEEEYLDEEDLDEIEVGGIRFKRT